MDPPCELGTIWMKTQRVFCHAVLGVKSAIMLGKYIYCFLGKNYQKPSVRRDTGAIFSILKAFFR